MNGFLFHFFAFIIHAPFLLYYSRGEKKMAMKEYYKRLKEMEAVNNSVY